jgi:hypothetical protein
MPDDEQQPSNSLLATALGMIEGVAPGALDDPEAALRDLVPQLRFLAVARIDKPSIQQVRALQAFDAASSLVQLRKAIQERELEFGPFPEPAAEQVLVPELREQGLSVSLRELTAAEKAPYLDCLDEG